MYSTEFWLNSVQCYLSVGTGRQLNERCLQRELFEELLEYAFFCDINWDKCCDVVGQPKFGGVLLPVVSAIFNLDSKTQLPVQGQWTLL